MNDQFFRIGWIDSVGYPSRVHLTSNNGLTTICGHEPERHFNMETWVLSKVPVKINGQSRFCKVCFSGQKKKSLPWVKNEIETSQDS